MACVRVASRSRSVLRPTLVAPRPSPPPPRPSPVPPPRGAGPTAPSPAPLRGLLLPLSPLRLASPDASSSSLSSPAWFLDGLNVR
uniref:Uncharacterized protein n=1 Tax=Oryza punctata TaxID=4537 RepID=A0A0E0JHQ7_ORYPU